MFSIILVLSWIIPIHALTGYDCTDNPINITSISLSRVHHCKSNSQVRTMNEHNVQIIQQTSFTHVEYLSCMIEMSDLVTHCGMHSHSSQGRFGLRIGSIYDISEYDCRLILTTRQFITSYGNTIN